MRGAQIAAGKEICRRWASSTSIFQGGKFLTLAMTGGMLEPLICELFFREMEFRSDYFLRCSGSSLQLCSGKCDGHPPLQFFRAANFSPSQRRTECQSRLCASCSAGRWEFGQVYILRCSGSSLRLAQASAAQLFRGSRTLLFNFLF